MDGRSEGVIQFQIAHDLRPLDARVHGESVSVLGAWREILARLGLIGRDPSRYEGLGYGNASIRVGPMGDIGRGRRRFLVTGTQTGGKRRLTLDDFCLVERYDVIRNEVSSVGLVQPSSEALTHAALYDIAPAARVVLHGHGPEIWRRAAALGIPITRTTALHGTSEMAREVQRLHRESTLSGSGILAMGGHEDGVITLGRTAGEAGEILVRYLARALASA
jgi:ribulose-5-phosphate 4-epimerase/fuculose-1-phosphate aldolase